jgi:hypothetical protein
MGVAGHEPSAVPPQLAAFYFGVDIDVRTKASALDGWACLR